MTSFNMLDAPNAAMTSLFQGGDHWRGIGDPDCSAQAVVANRQLELELWQAAGMLCP